MDAAETWAMASPPTYATCVREATYSGALTRGKRYLILDVSEDREQVKVETDNKRQRWFPAYCFDMQGGDIPQLVQVVVQGKIEEPCMSPVEVVVGLSNGQTRWCFFVTPNALATLNQIQFDSGIVNVYGVPHMIVVSVLNEQIIRQALESIDKQGELEGCTLPIK